MGIKSTLSFPWDCCPQGWRWGHPQSWKRVRELCSVALGAECHPATGNGAVWARGIPRWGIPKL